MSDLNEATSCAECGKALGCGEGAWCEACKLTTQLVYLKQLYVK